MAIYLVQHGKNLSKDQDPRKGLSDQGRADVERIAQVAAQYGVRPLRIIHSGKQRALQTAEIMAAHLYPAQGVHTVEGVNPLDDVISFAAGLDSASGTMVVGHLPFLEKLAAYLVSGQDQSPIFQFQNGGIVCLDDYRDSKQMVIKWALMPEIS